MLVCIAAAGWVWMHRPRPAGASQLSMLLSSGGEITDPVLVLVVIIPPGEVGAHQPAETDAVSIILLFFQGLFHNGQTCFHLIGSFPFLIPLGLDLAKTAAIARQWKFLDPLRAACEGAGMPVAMADEEAPPLWRLRETQGLLAFLDRRHEEASRYRLLKAEDILSWLDTQAATGWRSTLREAIAVFNKAGAGAALFSKLTRELFEKTTVSGGVIRKSVDATKRGKCLSFRESR